MSEDTLTLELSLREVTGKSVKKLRGEGTVPAVIHDHGKPSLNVQAPYLVLYRTYLRAGKHHPVELIAGDHKFTALIKSATFEPRKNMLTHIVFNAVDRNQKVEAEVPVRPRYAEGETSSPAERSSLIVLEQLEAVEVRAIPSKIPDVLEYDAEKLIEDGDQLTVADLIVPDGVEIITDATHPIVAVTTTAALDAANAATAGDAEAEAPAAAAETAEGTAEASAEAADATAETKPE